MKSFGLIVEDGIIKGFKMPEHDVHKEQFAERNLKQKLTKEQLRYADHALEFRARWLFESVGYGDSSCNVKEGDRMPASSKIPIGCEIPEIVAKAIAILDKMKKMDALHRNYVMIINTVYLERKESETILNSLKRSSFSKKQFENARARFASIINNF